MYKCRYINILYLYIYTHTQQLPDLTPFPIWSEYMSICTHAITHTHIIIRFHNHNSGSTPLTSSHDKENWINE